jgi:hypothetical protein
MQEMTAPSPTSPPSLLNPPPNLGTASHSLTHCSILMTHYCIAEPEPEPLEGGFFASAEPEPACIPYVFPVLDLDPDPI